GPDGFNRLKRDLAVRGDAKCPRALRLSRGEGGLERDLTQALRLHHLDALDARLDGIAARNGRHVPEPWHVLSTLAPDARHAREGGGGGHFLTPRGPRALPSAVIVRGERHQGAVEARNGEREA